MKTGIDFMESLRVLWALDVHIVADHATEDGTRHATDHGALDLVAARHGADHGASAGADCGVTLGVLYHGPRRGSRSRIVRARARAARAGRAASRRRATNGCGSRRTHHRLRIARDRVVLLRHSIANVRLLGRRHELLRLVRLRL